LSGSAKAAEASVSQQVAAINELTSEAQAAIVAGDYKHVRVSIWGTKYKDAAHPAYEHLKM
jgi:hypothetical protein